MPEEDVSRVKQALLDEKGKTKTTQITATWIIKGVKTSEHQRAIDKIKKELILLEPDYRTSGIVTNLTPNDTSNNV